VVQNQPYDESVDVSDTEEVASVQASPRVPGGGTEMEQDVRQKDAHPLGWIG